MTLTIETTSTPTAATASESDNAEAWRGLKDALSSVVCVDTDALSRVEGEVSDLLARDYEDWPKAGPGPLTPDSVIENFIAGVGADRVLGALDRLTSPTA